MCATFRASEPTRSDPVLISSRRNPLVRQLRQLHTPAGRREAGLLLIEGTHLAQEVARLGLKPHHLLCSEAWQQRQPALMKALQAA
ncbi:MAG: RNA methyltransferase, partial [Cyanobacteria bacterium M_surface_7_m2_040]|nr:RNA methyltransferase [Cyanobacteria bacterium M_surface_7_m2_040]